MVNIKNTFRVGMTAVEVVAKIVEINPRISAIYFFVYHPTHNIKETRKKGRPLLSRLLCHNPAKDKLWAYCSIVTPEKINKLFVPPEEDNVLGVLSRVKAGRKYLHIPMMDFEKSREENTLHKIEHFLQEIGQEGVILFSGRSYHFYGTNLMTNDERLDFLGDCILSGLGDLRYIGHQLKDPFSTLRLSACPLRPEIPKVVSIVARKISTK